MFDLEKFKQLTKAHGKNLDGNPAAKPNAKNVQHVRVQFTSEESAKELSAIMEKTASQ